MIQLYLIYNCKFYVYYTIVDNFFGSHILIGKLYKVPWRYQCCQLKYIVFFKIYLIHTYFVLPRFDMKMFIYLAYAIIAEYEYYIYIYIISL